MLGSVSRSYVPVPAQMGLNAQFETDGTLVFSGDATVWDDLQVNLSSVRLPVANAPSWASYQGGQVLEFSGSQTNTIYFVAQVQHKYKLASDIEFHIHYVPEDAGAGNVRWVFTHSWVSILGNFPSETTVTTILATPEVADRHVYGEIAAAIDGSGKGISSILICSLARTGDHGDDTYDNKVIRLVALDFHVEMDTLGSREETTK